MLRNVLISMTLTAGMVSGVFAQACTCTGSTQTRITGAAVTAALSNKTVCVRNAANTDWEWQEEHFASSELWDYKKGPNHAIDPREPVGNWAVNGNTVTHTYNGGGGSFSYSICQGAVANSIGFCPAGGGTTIMSTTKAIGGGC